MSRGRFSGVEVKANTPQPAPSIPEGRWGKLLDASWPISFTNPRRYRSNGVTYHVIDHAQASSKRFLTILDVGCSTGVAVKRLKANLEKLGIRSEVIGVDISKKVMQKAKRNLDRFVCSDIRLLGKEDLPLADVVICSYAAIWVTANTRYEMVHRCAEQLRDDGLLVTNAFPFRRVDLPKPVEFLRYRFESIPFLAKGRTAFSSELERRKAELLKRRSFAILGRTEALAYAESVRESWIRLDSRSKSRWHFTVFLQAWDYHTLRILWSLLSQLKRRLVTRFGQSVRL
jgi:SAM-dependent methyltransferase